jgi:hypothetical protein
MFFDRVNIVKLKINRLSHFNIFGQINFADLKLLSAKNEHYGQYIMVNTLWSIHYGQYIRVNTLWSIHYGQYIMVNTLYTTIG